MEQKIGIIVASTRPERKGIAVAQWVNEQVQKKLLCQLLDLQEINLPFLNEPREPSEGSYIHKHTQEWSKKVAAYNGFIIVTPEYNHSFPAPLKNALDTLYDEWNHKPVAFVSYGGMSGGIRAVAMLKIVVCALKMVPVYETVSITNISKKVDRTFHPEPKHQKKLSKLITSLVWWMNTIANSPK